MNTNFSAKQFVYAVLTVPLLLVIITSLLSYFAKHLYENSEYPMWEFNKKFTQHNTKLNVDVLAIGDSRFKAAFIPRDSNSLNLSLGGSSPIEGYYTLRDYLKFNQAPKQLLLSYAPYHLMEVETFWKRTIKFKYLSYADEEEVFSNAVRLKDSLASSKQSRWAFHLTPQPHIAAIKNGLVEKRWQNYQPKLNELTLSYGHSYFGQGAPTEGNLDSELVEFKVSPLIDYYLSEIFTLASENDISIYWYTAPYSQLSYDLSHAEFNQGYAQYIYSLEANINVISEVYAMDNDMFGDSSHVYEGAADVTAYIYQHISAGSTKVILGSAPN